MSIAERITDHRIIFSKPEREDALSPAEMKRKLESRAKLLLEQAGFGLKKMQSGEYLIIAYNNDNLTEEVIAQFDDIISLGQTFNFWGSDGPGDRDENGLDRPLTAALRATN